MPKQILPGPTIAKKGEKHELVVVDARVRDGCDKCHTDQPTERFVGFLGHVLWICDECFHEMTAGR
jgi:hypothetical protein